MGPKAGLDWCGKPRRNRDSISGSSSPGVSLYRLRYPGLHVHKIIKSKFQVQRVARKIINFISGQASRNQTVGVSN